MVFVYGNRLAITNGPLASIFCLQARKYKGEVTNFAQPTHLLAYASPSLRVHWPFISVSEPFARRTQMKKHKSLPQNCRRLE